MDLCSSWNKKSVSSCIYKDQSFKIQAGAGYNVIVVTSIKGSSQSKLFRLFDQNFRCNLTFFNLLNDVFGDVLVGIIWKKKCNIISISGDRHLRVGGGKGKFSVRPWVEGEDHDQGGAGAGHQAGETRGASWPAVTLVLCQIEDGSDFRVLISPLPPKVEEIKKVEKVKEKKADNR